MRKLALYFCKFRLNDHSNLYNRFVYELKVRMDETAFSSLNYDLLFDLALKENMRGKITI
jgi:hypothetical protein